MTRLGVQTRAESGKQTKSGIVFDTHEGGGAVHFFVGYRFRYPCLRRVRFSCGVGIVFDTHVCVGCVPLVWWVSFSIPVFAVGALSWVQGIVFDTRYYIAVFLACLRTKKSAPKGGFLFLQLLPIMV